MVPQLQKIRHLEDCMYSSDIYRKKNVEQGEVLSEPPICDKNEEIEQNINECQRLSPCTPGDFENMATTEGCARSLSSNKFAVHASVNGRLLFKTKQSKILPGRHRKRLILKNGSTNVVAKNVEKRRQRYLQDLFITLVDIQWRWNLLIFSMGFIITWLVFAVIWWLINYSHGDFFHMNDTNWEPCVHNIKSFTSAFLFSLETQHTIGYGSRYVNEECPEAVFVLCLQSITGVMIQCFIVGMVFAKFSRPKKRQQTLMFSRNAIVCLRDGKLCLMFRVGNMRKSPVIGAQITLHLIKRKTTTEGEVIPYYQSQLDIRHDSVSNSLFLSWPVVIIHEINQHSPLYAMSAEDFLKDKFELIAILEGTTESTGQSFQAKSSYLSREIVWGQRFEQIISYSKETGDFLVDYGKFNNTYETETPLCSAKQFYEFQKSFSVDCERYENHNMTREHLKNISSLRSPFFDIIEGRSISSTE